MRAIRTLRRLGIQSVAVYSEPDRFAAHVRAADVAIALGGTSPVENYLDIDKILLACANSNAQAVFPGYGFLSESAEFASACESAGIVFIGPTPHQLHEFGLKHRARALAEAADVPLNRGTDLLGSVDEALAAAEEIGYPVMLKTTAGGGGIGLSRCADAAELSAAFSSVTRLGEEFFRDGGVFLERFVDQARHVEVQILGDGHGTVVALGERDCSLQRRNQKVVEETPAPHLPQATRVALHRAAERLGESINYRSAGTVEFVYDANRDEFHFLEVNTRLQVEHGITEMVTGLDLVECMLRVAAGEALDFASMRNPPTGAAIEVRVYAEDPVHDFQPSPGTLTEVSFPNEVRVDGWVATGTEVSAYYDPLLAKVMVHGTDRADALAKLQVALADTRLCGIQTNLDYLQTIIATDTFTQARATTRFLDGFSYQPQAIEILQAGTSTTIQDYPGRLGYWHIGVPPSGPMDDYSFRMGNRLVGNQIAAAGFEATLVGPTLQFHVETVFALTGAKVDARLDGEPVPMWTAVTAQAGQTLTTGQAREGCRTYIAVRGGLDVPEYLGSRATFTLGQFGGHAGRVLRNGDLITLGQQADHTREPVFDGCPDELIAHYPSIWQLGCLIGPHSAPDYFTPESVAEFFRTDWQVHYNSNRLGIRLQGPKPQWARRDGGEAGLHPSNVHDCEYAIGSVNFTGDTPVILTVDGPSLGGFVCPVTIARAELWKVGQVKPGETIRFVPMDYATAVAAEQTQREALATLQGDLAELPQVPSTTLASDSALEHTRRPESGFSSIASPATEAPINPATPTADLQTRWPAASTEPEPAPASTAEPELPASATTQTTQTSTHRAAHRGASEPSPPPASTVPPSAQSAPAPNLALLAETPQRDHHPHLKIRQAGENYLLLEYGDDVLDLALRLRVHLLMQAIREAELPVAELAPGVRSLQVRYQPAHISQADLVEALLALDESLADTAKLQIPSRVVHLPMSFEDSATLAAVQRYQETVRSKAP